MNPSVKNDQIRSGGNEFCNTNLQQKSCIKIVSKNLKNFMFIYIFGIWKQRCIAYQDGPNWYENVNNFYLRCTFWMT